MRSRLCATGVLAIAVLSGWSLSWCASQRPSNRSTWGRILVIGDEQESQRGRDFAELYDPATNRFAVRRPAMKNGRNSASATVIRSGPNAGKVLITGGFSEGHGGPLTTTELYDPATNRFIRGPNLSVDLDDHTATEIGSGSKAQWILVAGFETTNLYDPMRNRFVVGRPMIDQRAGHTATVVTSGPDEGKILFAGGILDNKPSNYSGRVTELYDPVSNSFEVGAAMNTGRNNHTATVIPSGANAGKILLVGGWTDRTVKKDVSIPVSLASTELYDAATRSFAQPNMTATLKAARAFHTATVISLGPNAGGILIAGGQRDDENPLSSTEIYDPATNSFKPGPAMHSPRSQHAAIVIASGSNAGKILIAGGMELGCYSVKRGCAPVLLSSTEIYDPTTNTFTPGPEMHGAPGQTLAIQLPPAPLR